MAVIPPLVVGIVHARIAKYLNEHARTQKDSRRAQKELERNKKTTVLLSGESAFCYFLLPHLSGNNICAKLKMPLNAAKKTRVCCSIMNAPEGINLC